MKSQMKRVARIVAAVTLATGIAMSASACSPSVEAGTIEDGTVVIDVRTPAEFADGHLEGAINIDVQSSDFDAQVADLPTDADYVVYCRSGNRSATAVARLDGLGFESLIDAGSLEAASASTGLPIVK
ncbi:MAG: rhodanese-like domain-containing protein [Microbacteriaceae bacterium]